MRLVKIKDGRSSNRSATYQELITNYIFQSGKPRKFIPNEYYTAGDIVYIIDDDNYATMYRCLYSDYYTNITSKNWETALMLPDVRKEIKTYIAKLTSEYDMTFDVSGVSNNDLTINIVDNIIILPDSYTSDSHIILFINGKYKSQDFGEYDITKVNGKFVIETTFTLSEDDTVVVDIITPVSHNSKLIGYQDYVASAISSEELSFSVDSATIANDSVIDLYVDRLFVPESEYEVTVDSENDSITVTFNEDSTYSVSESDIKAKYVISVTSSRSKSISISKNVYKYTVKNDTECYRIELDGSNVNGSVFVYNGHTLIPNDYINISDGVLSITNEEFYSEVNNVISVVCLDFDVLIDTVKTKSESIVVGANEFKIPIPIINYDESVHDIIVFKESGIHVSRSRYFVKDGYVVFYSHDTSLTAGETLYFQLFNEDKSVSISSRIVMVNTENARLSLPKNFNGSLTSFLLFRLDGTYVNKNMYTISEDNTYITFTSDVSFDDGECFEFIFNEYLSQVTNTITKIGNIAVTTKNIIQLPINHYDTTTYNTVVFNDTLGTYVDNSRYSVDESGVLTITDGTGIDVGDTIDIYIIVNLPSQIGIKSVKLSISSL